MSKTVYISFNKNTITDRKRITIGDVSTIWCEDNHILARIKNITLVNPPEVKSRRYVFSVIRAIELIKRDCDNLEITPLGASEFIVSYKNSLKTNPALNVAKIILVSAIVFFGGAFAIMAYGNDIDVNGVFAAVADFVTGNKADVLWLQVAYCVGLSAGIILFYNHLGKRREKKDPTPLEVQMILYEDDVDSAIINESRAGGMKEHD